MNAKQKKEIQKIRLDLERAKSAAFQKERKPLKLEDLFDGCPEGDFCWDGEPEDVGTAYHCGESDCPCGWHESIQCIERGRENGKTFFIIREDSNAGDGDYQPVAGWDEREGDEVTPEILEDLWYHFEGRLIEHFYGWGMYFCDVAETGEDPLNQYLFGKVPTYDDAISAAKSNLGYLKK